MRDQPMEKKDTLSARPVIDWAAIIRLDWRPVGWVSVLCLLLYGGWLQVDIRLSNTPDRPAPVPVPPSPVPVPPQPVPVPPGPQPDKPELTGLAKLAYEWVPSEGSAKVAHAIAKNFRGVAAAIAAGTLTTHDEIIKATFEANQLAMDGEHEIWKVWGGKFAEEMEKREDEFRKPGDYAEAWRDIAQGLGRVK